MQHHPASSTLANDLQLSLVEVGERQNETQRLQIVTHQREVLLEDARRIALNILVHRTGADALRHLLEATRALLNARVAALALANLEGEGLKEFLVLGLSPEEEAAINARSNGLGVLDLLIRSECAVRIDRLSEHPVAVGLSPDHPPMDSFLGAPILRDGTLLGCLYLVNREDGAPFTETDEATLTAMAEYVAVALHFEQELTRHRLLTSGFLHALEEERRTVAYELHDGLTQYVMASCLYLDSFYEDYQATGQGEPPEMLEKAVHFLHLGVVESRRLISGLRILSLEALGLAGALEQLLRQEAERAGWTDAAFHHNIQDRRFEVTQETVIYRVAQEALTNIRKHAGTTRVVMLLMQKTVSPNHPAQLTLEVHDWGQGFELNRQNTDREHLGLKSMAERARLMHGTFHITSEPGRGSHIVATFPMQETEIR